jgi:hypothetical protein
MGDSHRKLAVLDRQGDRETYTKSMQNCDTTPAMVAELRYTVPRWPRNAVSVALMARRETLDKATGRESPSKLRSSRW